MQKNGDQEDGDFALFGEKEREDVWGERKCGSFTLASFIGEEIFLSHLYIVEVKLDYRIISFVVNIFN